MGKAIAVIRRMDSSGKASRTASSDSGRAAGSDGGTGVAAGGAIVGVGNAEADSRDTAVGDGIAVGVAGSGGAGTWADGVGVDGDIVGVGSAGRC